MFQLIITVFLAINNKISDSNIALTNEKIILNLNITFILLTVPIS